MICIDIWHKYHEWCFKIAIRNFRQFRNITSGIYVKYHVQIMLLFVYTTTRKRFVIFTCGYFKLSWNTTALNQSNCRNFSCSTIKTNLLIFYSKNSARSRGENDCYSFMAITYYQARKQDEIKPYLTSYNIIVEL